MSEQDTTTGRTEDVRAFLTGFLAKRGPVDPLGQSLAQGLLGPLTELPDEAIAAFIERGHEVRRAG
ncbi:MAG: hypothetical protein ACRBN8_22580 [Nannocystales bacterium]